MTTPTSLHDRLNDKAKAGVQFAAITSRDNQNRVKTVLVPGSEGKQYEVIIRREKVNGLIVFSGECNCKTSCGNVPCKGNGKSVCYHVLIGIMKAVEEHGTKIAFCADEKRAKKLSNLGGLVFRVTSYQGQGELYAVAS